MLTNFNQILTKNKKRQQKESNVPKGSARYEGDYDDEDDEDEYLIDLTKDADRQRYRNGRYIQSSFKDKHHHHQQQQYDNRSRSRDY